jgi:UPF0716 family protein affecting phage T7 exclusion
MIYFLVYLFLEVVISVNIASAIGGIFTFFELILTAMIGIAILFNFRNTIVENMKAVSYNCINLRQFQELNLFTLFGALLLILPGFLTDIVGMLMQFSVITTMLVNRYSAKYGGKCDTPDPFSSTTSHFHYHERKDDDVIDVEIISDSDKR